jgi:hypothetical protein
MTFSTGADGAGISQVARNIAPPTMPVSISTSKTVEILNINIPSSFYHNSMLQYATLPNNRKQTIVNHVTNRTEKIICH